MTNATTRLVCTLVGLLALSCGGGSEPPPAIPQTDACPEASTTICKKIFSCSADDVVLGLMQEFLGGSEMNCRATITQNYCGSFTCTAGQTYHGDKAGLCKAEFGQVTCAEIGKAAAAAALSGTVDIPMVIGALVPACNQVCSAD